MPAPVTKLDLPSYVLAQGVSPIEDWLVSNGWTAGTDETHALACACFKLGFLYGLGPDGVVQATVKIHVEYTPSHYQLTVDLI